MTDDEINERVGKWWLYSLVGNPEEADYGPDTPRGMQSAGLESQYRSPQNWHAAEPRKDATRADYMLVEPIYRRRCVRDRMTICYYAQHPAKLIRFTEKDVMQAFRNEVGNA